MPATSDATVPDGMDLTPIQVDSWRGMVFVCLDPTVRTAARVARRSSPTKSPTCRSSRSASTAARVRNVACNWKTYGDNFMEGYHLPTVHPAMSRDADALNYKVIIKGDRRWNIHEMPPRDESTFGVFGWFWPTFAFDVFPGGFAVERWLPRGHSHSDLIFEYFFADDTEHDVEAIIKFSEQVADEDARVCEHVQRNLDRRQLRHRRAQPEVGGRHPRLPRAGARGRRPARLTVATCRPQRRRRRSRARSAR